MNFIQVIEVIDCKQRIAMYNFYNL